jgi:membrane-bound metal-dependent hydrolase YbcI (DUF457 family)
MFIGHYAIAYATRKRNYLPSLAILFIAVQLLDLIWPVLVLLGIETFKIEEGNTELTPLNFTSYPYSHSLLMSFVWGVLLAIVYFAFTRNKRSSMLLVPLVVSHWVLDYITHKPDLPLSPFGNTKVGLGLWNNPVAEIILETSMFFMAVLLYFRRIKPKRLIAYWSLAVVFLIIYFANIFGPPPPSINAVAWSANLMWLFIIWAWWIEREKSKIVKH